MNLDNEELKATKENQEKYTNSEIDNYIKLQKENNKQSKVIDEMAEYLAIIRVCPNEDKGANLDCENRCNNTDEIYEECWKLYFYRKVEEDAKN